MEDDPKFNKAMDMLEDALRRLQTVSLACEFAFELVDISVQQVRDVWREVYGDDAEASGDLLYRMEAIQQRARELYEEIQQGNASVLGSQAPAMEGTQDATT